MNAITALTLQRENWRVETLSALTIVRQKEYDGTKGEIKWFSQRNYLLTTLLLC